MKRGARLSPRVDAIVAKAAALREQGATWAEVGAQLGVNYQRVRDAMYRRGFQMNGKRGRPRNAALHELVGKARVLRGFGVRWKVIERQLGVPWGPLACHIYHENKAAQQTQC